MNAIEKIEKKLSETVANCNLLQVSGEPKFGDSYYSYTQAKDEISELLTRQTWGGFEGHWWSKEYFAKSRELLKSGKLFTCINAAKASRNKCCCCCCKCK